MARPNAKAPLGQGGRFAAMKEKLAGRQGVTNPGALAAYIGRKKYGAEKMTSMAAKGRGHHSPGRGDGFDMDSIPTMDAQTFMAKQQAEPSGQVGGPQGATRTKPL